MRSDMDKLLCERPRKGGWSGSSKRSHEHEHDDDAPDKESIKPRGMTTKILNENLSPLKRFLQSRVGRSWDKVYSEIREHFDKSSAVKLHIFEHLKWMVEKNAVYRDGKYYEPRAHSRKSTTPEVSGFYVDQHGILCKTTEERYHWKRKKQPPNPNVIKIWDEKYFRILVVNGVWFMGFFVDLPVEQVRMRRMREFTYGNRTRFWEEKYTPPFVDMYLKRNGNYDAETCVRVYGERIYCRTMQQLGKREIRRWKKSLSLT